MYNSSHHLWYLVLFFCRHSVFADWYEVLLHLYTIHSRLDLDRICKDGGKRDEKSQPCLTKLV